MISNDRAIYLQAPRPQHLGDAFAAIILAVDENGACRFLVTIPGEEFVVVGMG